ncbi:unnamed protein product [Cuscuta campestris]|uniref:Uncharacterized protein n=1 Tax=Cuscuta campestris TaxID=132261 RepID=A0A484N1I1_9ASTE|nr:unnamed protein product [Cuscuta campestris]
MRTKNASVSYSKNGNDECHAEETMTENSGNPKATQGTFEVPAMKTKVNSKNFPHMKLTVKSSVQDFQKLMKEKLCNHMEILEVFMRDSPFGAFLDVQLVPPPAMLWQLMVREANVEGEKASEDEVAAGRNSSSDKVHSSSEGSEVPSKKYVFRRRKISRPSTPTFSPGKAEHRSLLEKQSPLLERTTNIKASSISGNASENLPDSLRDYIDGKFSELQKTIYQEVENVLERKFQTLEKRILQTLLDTLKGRCNTLIRPGLQPLSD